MCCNIPYYAAPTLLCGSDPAVWFKWDQTVTQTTIKSLVKFVLPDYQWSCILHTKQRLRQRMSVNLHLWWSRPHSKAGCVPPTRQCTHLKALMNKASHFKKRQMIIAVSLRELCFWPSAAQAWQYTVKWGDTFWLVDTKKIKALLEM